MNIRQVILLTLAALNDEGHPVIFNYEKEEDMKRLVDKVNHLGDSLDILEAK